MEGKEKYLISENGIEKVIESQRWGTLDAYFTLDDWNKILKESNNCCVRCGASINLTIDHIIPLSKDGTNFPNNLQPLCRSCNAKKSNKVLVNT